MAKTQSGRRKLKPEIEKKRRDRINQNLSVLRTLLFNTTADTRLQNPKLEKAEILDLAVQYIQKNTSDNTDEKVSVNRTVIEITHPVSVAHTNVSDFTSFLGQTHHLETQKLRLEYYLDCLQGHSPRAEREAETKSPNSHSKFCLSASVSPSRTQESSSVDSKAACPKPIVLTQSGQFSPPSSPLYLPFTAPVSPPFSSSPPLYTTAFSVCSPGSLPQLLQLHNPRALSTSMSLNLDTRVSPPSQTTWRPWS